MVLFKKKERKKKDRCVLPLLFVKSDSSLKECNGQMFILAYAAIKRLRSRKKLSLPLENMVRSTSPFSVTCAFRQHIGELYFSNYQKSFLFGLIC